MDAPALAAHLADLPPVEVIYTDLDGTLLGPGGSLLTAADGTPSTAAAQALVDAAIACVTVVCVSGRAWRQLANDARILGLSGCIAEAGSVIVRAGTARYEWGEAPRSIADTPHSALERSGALALLLDRFAGDLRPYEPWHRGREGGHLLHGRVDAEEADALLEAGGFGWAHLVDNGAAGGWEGREVRAYHLLPRGVGKARAVADDLADRGLTPADALAVGDSEADATMSSTVGTYLQVANGHAAVGGNRFAVDGAMGHGFAEAVTAALSARAR
jgi:phosphoglycolate phosphatase